MLDAIDTYLFQAHFRCRHPNRGICRVLSFAQRLTFEFRRIRRG